MDDITKMALIVVVVAVGGVFLYGMLVTDMLDILYEDHYGEPPPHADDGPTWYSPGCS